MNICRPEIAVGFAESLAVGNDDEQATFFNTFFAELEKCCGSRSEDQLYYLAKKLNNSGAKGIRNLQEFRARITDVDESNGKKP